MLQNMQLVEGPHTGQAPEHVNPSWQHPVGQDVASQMQL
jgi:hypothetical protein